MFPAPASNGSRSRQYRSKRAVRRPKEIPTHIVTRWTKGKVLLVCCGVGALAMTTIFPIFMLESTLSSPSSSKSSGTVSLHGLVKKSMDIEQEYKAKGKSFFSKAANQIRGVLHVEIPAEPISQTKKTVKPYESTTTEPIHKITANAVGEDDKADVVSEIGPSGDAVDAKDEKKTTPKFPSSAGTKKKQRLARGVSGLPMSKTPALVGAKPGHVDCDVDVDDIVYWNDPQGERDRNFVSPFATPEEHYLTFEPDRGGWNNIRMSMEIIFVLAAATGRTLVLPPKSPFYLFGTGKQNARAFGNFYNLNHPDFQKKVKVITMSEFLEREKYGLLNLSDEDYEKLKPIADLCLHGNDSLVNCDILYEHLREVGVQPDMAGMNNCLIFDLDRFQGKPVSESAKNHTARFCGGKRTPVYYDDEMHLPQLIHWNAGGQKHRLLNHFYGFFLFTDPKIDNFYKRFVRDFLHYKDDIYCAAVSYSMAGDASWWLPAWSSTDPAYLTFKGENYSRIERRRQGLVISTREAWRSSIQICQDSSRRMVQQYQGSLETRGNVFHRHRRTQQNILRSYQGAS